MWSDTEKTIPYKPTESELESLRLLRKRTSPSETLKKDEEKNGVVEADDHFTNTPEPSIDESPPGGKSIQMKIISLYVWTGKCERKAPYLAKKRQTD
jgi:hypothetical protein